MQLMKYRKHSALVLTFAIAALTITPATRPDIVVKNCNPPCALTTRLAAGTVLFTALVTFIRLVTKRTQPKRVYPKDDSFSEAAWYIFDELLTGQMEKGERPSKVTFDQENPSELTIQYSKIEARGLAGILYSAMKPVIIPALTFMVLFNKDFLHKVAEGIYSTKTFLNDPTISYNNFMTIVEQGELPKSGKNS